MPDLAGSKARFERMLAVLAGLFFLTVLCLMLFAQNSLSAYYSQPALLPNLLLLPAALALLATAALLRGLAARLPRHIRWGALLALYFPLLLALQLLFTRSVWYYPGFDVINVYQDAQRIAEGSRAATTYYNLCPNNAPITLLLSVPLWVAVRLGLAVPYVVLPYLGAVMANVALLLTMVCIGRLTQSRFARLGSLLLGTAWIAFSMLTTVPYTDIFAIVFPVLALMLYLGKLRPLPKWFLISLTLFFGASIKPTVLILLIALVVVEGRRALAGGRLTARKTARIGAVLLALAIGAAPGLVWQNVSTAYMTGTARPEGQLSETHYLMLGMNGDTFGGHSPDDVTFSTSFATLSQRRQANLLRAWERLTGRTFAANVAFFATKAYKAFSDGTFAADQSFLVLDVPARQDGLSVFLRSVFHRKGSLHPLLVTLQQGVWLTVLVMGIFALLGRNRRPRATAVLGLTVLGVGLYLLLFEVWPRYMYVYAPFFLILAALGLERLRFVRRLRPAASPRTGTN
jgi:hypothetical protein